MKIEELRQNRFVRNFKKDQWLVLSSLGIVMALSTVYICFFFQPDYQSEAKVWIKDTSTRNYVGTGTEGDEPGFLSPLTQSDNPVMTQSEILTSKEMERYLAATIKQEEARTHHGHVIHDKPDTLKMVKVKTEPNTDVINVKLKWESPEMAQLLLKDVLAKLDQTNLNINKDIYTKKRAYIDQQVQEIQGKLMAVREQLKKYQTGSMNVDLDTQTEELVKLKSSLVQQLDTVQASHYHQASNAQSLQGQLAMAPKAALRAVAEGSGDENLVKMRSDLAALQQQYSHDRIKEAPTNPHLMALKAQMDTLQNQVSAEDRRNGGKGADTGPLIFDQVRSQLVQDLSSSNAESSGLGAEAKSLQAAIAQVDASLKAIPQSRYTLSGLQQEERTLAQALQQLQDKEIDARIREAETSSNVFVVDPPTLPEKPSFPSPLHLFIISFIFGCGVGLGLSMLKTKIEDRCEGREAIEEATKSKLLGIVPWLGSVTPNREDYPSMFTLNDLACKHIISTLWIEAKNHNAEAIAFTSSSLERPAMASSYEMAKMMSAMGQTVAYIDTDFRPSNLQSQMPASARPLELTDLILATDLKLRSGQPVYPEEIRTGLVQDQNGIYVAMNRNPVANTFDYFTSKGFRHLVRSLKEQFDWVFINTPPAKIAPEFMTIAHMADGVVLFADRDATYQTLRKISEKTLATQTPFLGTISRERNAHLENDDSIYADWRDPDNNDDPPNGPRGGGGPTGRSKFGRQGVTRTAEKKRVNFMGAKIDALTLNETLDQICEKIDRREPIQHVVVNVAKLMTMRKDKRLRDIVNKSDIINADGAGIVIGARLLGLPIPERVAGIDLMQSLIAMSQKKRYRLFFLGATEDVVRDVVTTYQRIYPELTICGYNNGYFDGEEEEKVVLKIQQAKPDILFVAMGSPMKEKFIGRYKAVMDVPFVMGVGGSFDVVAGKVKRAPQWAQQAGLEWSFRLAQEPGRMWKRYLTTNAEFGFALMGQAISRKMGWAHG